MAITMTTSGAVIIKAGANATTVLTGDNINQFINEAESMVNATIHKNFTKKYSTLTNDVKHILNDVVSSDAAMAIIHYDMDGFGRIQAQTMLDILNNRVTRGLSLLKDKVVTDFMEKDT